MFSKKIHIVGWSVHAQMGGAQTARASYRIELRSVLIHHLDPTLLAPSDSLEVAWCANVCLGQPLLLPSFGLFLLLGEGGVHNVVHLRVVMVTLDTADCWVFDVDSGHGQRRAWKIKGIVLKLQFIQCSSYRDKTGLSLHHYIYIKQYKDF